MVSAVILLFLGTFFLHNNVFASYVLPYPSYMPGNKLYRLSRLIDTFNKYWYFGNIAQVKYHLGLSDKYLVEAKTLFDYNQYLLAIDALHRSSDQFAAIMPNVLTAEQSGDDMTQFRSEIQEASIAHKTVITTLLQTTPNEFLWQPERASATRLYIHNELSTALSIQ